MESTDSTISHLPIRRLCQNISLPQPDIVPVPSSIPPIVNIDAPPKYSPPPSYSKAIGFRVAKALRNSIRRSVRRFRRNDEPRIESFESNNQNIPTISGTVQTQPQSQLGSQPNRGINEFIRATLRSTIRGTSGGTQSVENLVMSDMSLDERSIDSQVQNRDNASENLI